MGLFDTIKSAIEGRDDVQKSAGVGLKASKVRNAPKENPFAKVKVLSRSENEARVEKYGERVQRINDLEDEIEKLSDEELQNKTNEFRERMVSGGESEDDILEEAFAVVREAAFRTLGQRHYDVQIMGGMALHDGCVAEMATGEGKTLVSTLPVYLSALRGESATLVVTANDYLARRDAGQMGKVHRFLGLSVGLVQSRDEPPARRRAYACDITYVTNSELGFDYLRDHLALTSEDVVLTTRRLGLCVVDEADSILIDEARTPLIISGKGQDASAKYGIAMQIAAQLAPRKHYIVLEKEQNVVLTNEGTDICERALKVSSLYDASNPWAPYIANALKAKEVFKRDVAYVVQSGEVQIVDEFTGRVMPGRRWGNGLHQAVEAKEKLEISSETMTIASISFQSFFRLFGKLAGMTGTAATDAAELKKVYELDTVQIPTALPVARKDLPDAVFKTQQGKRRAVMREVALEHTKGRPMLIGTTSVEASEALSELLSEVEVPHQVLNARADVAQRESLIIAQAGRKYAITLATNMAGRGTDILLGGNPAYYARSAVAAALTPIIDPSAAQGDAPPAQTTQDPLLDPPCELSAESLALIDAAAAAAKGDAVLKKTVGAAELKRALMDTILDGVMDDQADVLVKEAVLESETVDAIGVAIDAAREEFKVATDEEKEEVMGLGGLYVIGTERHESQRIDNQLRGRSGRQGDAGSSRFFLGMDDQLFQLFGGDKMANVLNAFRVEEDTPIENSMVTTALDSAQRNVEAYYAGLREALAEYDEVCSIQREDLYRRRQRVLMSEDADVESVLYELCAATAKEITAGYGDGEEAKLGAKLEQFFAGIERVGEVELSGARKKKKLDGYVADRVKEAVERKLKQLGSSARACGIVRYVLLTQYDNLWQQQIANMEQLKDTVGYQAMGAEVEPIDLYRSKGLDIFNAMLDAVRRNAVFSLFQYNPKSTPPASS